MPLLTKKLPDWKVQQIQHFASKIKSAKTVGLVDIKGMPASQFHTLRAKLRDRMDIHVVKKTIIKFAIERAKEEKDNIKQVEEKIGDMPALIFSDLDPFKVSKLFFENKAPAFAKPGQVSPEDITIKEGPTPFTPGPMIAELQTLGIRTKVDAGKLVVQKDTVVAKAGEPIKPGVADLLVKLNIQPMEVGLTLSGAWESGKVFGSDVLNFDPGDYVKKMSDIASEAFAFSLGLPYPTKDNITILVTKAFRDSKALGLERGIMVKELVAELLAKATAQAQAIGKMVNK